MIALQNLQGVYIRGTYNYPARGDAISMSEVSPPGRLESLRAAPPIPNVQSQVSLDVAVPPSTGVSGSVAVGVEQCTGCPQGFTGASCQNPATGYCRKKQR